jgi:hypothetical protein
VLRASLLTHGLPPPVRLGRGRDNDLAGVLRAIARSAREPPPEDSSTLESPWLPETAPADRKNAGSSVAQAPPASGKERGLTFTTSESAVDPSTDSSRVSSRRDLTLMLGTADNVIRQHVAASNIHWGISSTRTSDGFSAQRNIARSFFVFEPKMNTSRPCHGCHRYRTDRISVTWAFRCRVVSRRAKSSGGSETGCCTLSPVLVILTGRQTATFKSLIFGAAENRV